MITLFELEWGSPCAHQRPVDVLTRCFWRPQCPSDLYSYRTSKFPGLYTQRPW